MLIIRTTLNQSIGVCFFASYRQRRVLGSNCIFFFFYENKKKRQTYYNKNNNINASRQAIVSHTINSIHSI